MICGSLLKKCLDLLDRGIHPTVISDAFYRASQKAVNILETTVGQPVDLADKESLIKAANTSLSSKIVSQYSNLLSPMAVECLLKVRIFTQCFQEMGNVSFIFETYASLSFIMFRPSLFLVYIL